MPKDEIYPAVSASPDIPNIEVGILDFWEKNDTFNRSVKGEKNPGVEPLKPERDEYVFYDGPPFANGLPHYGHLITGFVKDSVPRYQTMLGKKVARRFGWDCHGLPAEMQAEKETGISGRMAVMEYGIDKFNDACRTSVLRFTEDWRQYVTRQARWVDFDNDYKTLDLDYMESVIWAFKTLYDKGLIYEGLRVLPYSWAAETVLSNHETKLDDSYRERDDPALTVAFTVKELNIDAFNAIGSDVGDVTLNILAWTTTPWTLPSNLALAVGADVEYSVVSGERDGEKVAYILASALLSKYEKELEGLVPVATVTGAQLEGTTYQPLFPYFENIEGAFHVQVGDFVSTEDGTGIVHLAPYGEDDFELLSAKGIEIPVAVDAQGKFDSRISDYEGENVFDANATIAKDLKVQGRVLRHDTYRHPYPHCWRTDQPLIYRPMSSWFVKVTEIKEQMLKNNKEINWIPDHIQDGAFGMWLEGARDWSISRNRFWGSPIPVWVSDDPNYPRIDVYGSLDEIEADFGRRPTDLHRPEIDSFTRANPDDPTGKSTMRRVEEVFDCWFESGSMPFAQVHYPFENKDSFEKHYPGDFIVEYIAQSRGWFYTLHVLATALFDKPAFKTCIAHGNILGADGRKMSKRLKNYPDVLETFDNYGADAMRWFLQGSAVLRGQNLIVDNDGFANATRNAILPLWNSYYFFTLYANSDGIKAKKIYDSENILDQYMLSKTREFVEKLSISMDNNDLFQAHSDVESHLDVLTNWFIRRSRERFWKHEVDADKQAAYDTLYSVLDITCKAAAPLMPLITESIWRGLNAHNSDSEKASVHLENWPLQEVQQIKLDQDLIDAMDLSRSVCSNALSIRRAQNLRTRLPLAELIVAGPRASIVERFSDIIKDEVNVKSVTTKADASAYGNEKLNLIPAVMGPRHGADAPKIFAGYKKGEWNLQDGQMTVGGIELADDEYTLVLEPSNPEDTRCLDDRETIVALDINVTEELEREGIARDVIRAIQQQRKDLDLNVTDRIIVSFDADDVVSSAVQEHDEMIKGEVLANSIEKGSADDSYQSVEIAGDAKVALLISKS